MPEIASSQPKSIAFHVIYVKGDYTDKNNELVKFCEERGIRYTSRLFNSSKYSDDRYNIEQLPAIHIYDDISYQKTLYPTHTLFDILTEHYKEYERRMEEKRQRKIIWKKEFTKVYSLFKRVVTIGKTQAEKGEQTEQVLETPTFANPMRL